MNSETAQIAGQIAKETLGLWWHYAELGAEECVPHLGQALTALANSPVYGPQLLRTLLERLQARFGPAPRIAARAIRQIGSSAARPEVLAILLRYARTGKSETRLAAIEALGNLGGAGASPQVSETLLDILGEADMPTTLSAARALVRLSQAGHTPSGLVGAMVEHPRVRYALELAHRELEAPLPAAPSGSAPTPVIKTDLAPAPDRIGELIDRLASRDPLARARAARQLAEWDRAGIRVYGERRSLRVVTPVQLRQAAAVRRGRVPPAARQRTARGTHR